VPLGCPIELKFGDENTCEISIELPDGCRALPINDYVPWLQVRYNERAACSQRPHFLALPPPPAHGSMNGSMNAPWVMKLATSDAVCCIHLQPPPATMSCGRSYDAARGVRVESAPGAT
jgi:hypothetical protein